jgi:NTE family protein
MMGQSQKISSNIVVAVQGGGSHGAFAWGVLDRFFENGLEFDAVCGVSAGATLGAMAVQGFVRDGARGARADMARLWDRVSASHVFAPIQNALERWMWGWDIGREVGNTLAMHSLNAALQFFTPAQLNPLGQNPLRPMLSDLLDIEAIRRPGAPRLFVSATDVETGSARIFTNHEITVDVLLASSCMPTLFPTVMIDGRAYWDGGFTGNPPLAPLLSMNPKRLMLIRAQSRTRAGVPGHTNDILNRLQEIAFQAVVEAELSRLPAHIDFTEIHADLALSDLSASSRANTDREFLDGLFRAGRHAGADAGMTAGAV